MDKRQAPSPSCVTCLPYLNLTVTFKSQNSLIYVSHEYVNEPSWNLGMLLLISWFMHSINIKANFVSLQSKEKRVLGELSCMGTSCLFIVFDCLRVCNLKWICFLLYNDTTGFCKGFINKEYKYMYETLPSHVLLITVVKMLFRDVKLLTKKRKNELGLLDIASSSTVSISSPIPRFHTTELY